VARAVYSVHVYAANGLNGGHSDGVPAGFVLVLRDLDVYYNGLAGASVALQGNLSQTIWNNNFSASPNGQYASWRGRQVFDALTTWAIVTDAAMDVTLSGYLLSTP